MSETIDGKSDPCDLFTPEELGVKLGSGVAFTLCAIDAGCPTKGGLISHSMLVSWMTTNYNVFRRNVGLPELFRLVCSDGKYDAELDIRNMLTTFLDFTESRAFDPSVKAAAVDMRNFIHK